VKNFRECSVFQGKRCSTILNVKSVFNTATSGQAQSRSTILNGKKNIQ